MEKKPEKRPRDAATVGKALGEVLEKVVFALRSHPVAEFLDHEVETGP